jgi:hypothetical protein
MDLIATIVGIIIIVHLIFIKNKNLFGIIGNPATGSCD